MTKKEMIFDYLKSHAGMSQMDAYRLCTATRLAAVISVLKKEGHSITAELVTSNKTTYAVYHYHRPIVTPFTKSHNKRSFSHETIPE